MVLATLYVVSKSIIKLLCAQSIVSMTWPKRPVRAVRTRRMFRTGGNCTLRCAICASGMPLRQAYFGRSSRSALLVQVDKIALRMAWMVKRLSQHLCQMSVSKRKGYALLPCSKTMDERRPLVSNTSASTSGLCTSNALSILCVLHLYLRNQQPQWRGSLHCADCPFAPSAFRKWAWRGCTLRYATSAHQ